MIKEILDVRTGKREQVGGSGGSTELKLVAKGTLSEEGGVTNPIYNLDTLLEDNKLYLVRFNNAIVGREMCICSTSIQGSLNTFADDEETILPIIVYLYNDEVIFQGSIDTDISSVADTYCEVYELPYTLGGAE